MGQKVSVDGFEWSHTDEPHTTRRKLILAKYPQIKELMGPDYTMIPKIVFLVVTQLWLAYVMREAELLPMIVVAYCVGGTIAHSTTICNHECGHNLVFTAAHPFKNRLLGIFCNLGLGFPQSVAFTKYHKDHHKYQGDIVLDVGCPLEWEGKVFNNTFMKFIFCCMQPWFQSFRPLLTNPRPVSLFEHLNNFVQLSFDMVILYLWGWRSLLFMFMSTVLGHSLHPLSGHMVSDHTAVVDDIETYSYYGPLNFFAHNLGWHNEHHDFPNIPACRLPEVRRIAPEFYETLPKYSSWLFVFYNFIFNPKVGPYSRVKRHLFHNQKPTAICSFINQEVHKEFDSKPNGFHKKLQ